MQRNLRTQPHPCTPNAVGPGLSVFQVRTPASDPRTPSGPVPHPVQVACLPCGWRRGRGSSRGTTVPLPRSLIFAPYDFTSAALDGYRVQLRHAASVSQATHRQVCGVWGQKSVYGISASSSCAG